MNMQQVPVLNIHDLLLHWVNVGAAMGLEKWNSFRWTFDCSGWWWLKVTCSFCF